MPTTLVQPHAAASKPFLSLNMITILWTATILGLLFQVGHFFEHAFQFVVWCLGDLSQICGRDTPWLSGWAANMIDYLGSVVAPQTAPSRRMMLGLEILHLLGNGVFLATLGGLWYLTRNKFSRWAFYIEAFHLYEHIMLTSTAFFIGKPIGLSTLFGGSGLGPKEFAVGTRVTWHFALNLLPMPFAMMGLMDYWEDQRTMRQAALA
jgi:hypothetical protein